MPGILQALHSRGPDAHGVWFSPTDRALLVHTRLAIVGLGDEGAQPSVIGSSALTYNGEIYNYRSLADADQLSGPLSDTQVLHRHLDRVGPASCDRFRGMYAFAHWDESTGALTVARDPWGIKPLYLLEHPSGGVTVCSEIPPLLLHSDGRDLDPSGIAQYVAFGHTGPEVTFYSNITKLAPSTVVTFRSDGSRVLRTIDQATSFPTLDLEEALEDSVEAHFVADVDVGVFLSGGLDSTLVAASSKSRSAGLKTFTISFPDVPALDEGSIAEFNARLLGTDHHTVAVTTADMIRGLDRFLIEQGEPFGDPAALPLTVLAAEAARHVKVVQTGEGADEMFGGYRRYDVMHHLRHRGLEVIGRLLTPVADQVHSRRGDSARSRAIEAALRGGGVRGLAALVESDLPTVSRCSSGRLAAQRVADDWAALAGTAHGREAARRFDLARWLPNTYLEKTDRATMAASLEARTPFLDPAVSAAARRPGRQFGKGDLREVLERRLPGVQLPTVKKGLAIPVRKLLDAGLGSSLQFALTEGKVLPSVFGPAEIARLEARSTRSSPTAFRLAALGRWEQMTR